jgi:hypothetical protein
MRRLRKDVTDEEIKQHMRPHLTALMRGCVRRTEWSEQKEAQPGHEAAQPHRSSTAASAEPPALSEDEQELLRSIHSDPNLTITQRRDALGHSTHKANELKKALLRSGLIEEFTLNLGARFGGTVKLLALTKEGCKAIGKRPDREPTENVSRQHWWWQQQIARFYRAQGYEAEIERQLNGKRADCGFMKDGKTIAVEVGLSVKNEVVNAKRDLEAGFDRVLLACGNARIKKSIEQRKNVKLILLPEFSFVHEIFGKRPS